MGKTKIKQMKKRTHIIKSALELMNEHSFEDIGILDICKQADISTGTFYHYFSKKADILVGLLLLVDVHLEEEVAPYLTNDDEIENLWAIAHGFAIHVDQNGIERSIQISKIDISDTDISGGKRFAMSLVEKHVALGQEKGQLTTQYTVEEIADFFFIALRGVTTDWSRRFGSYSVVEKMDCFIRLFLESLRTKKD